MKNLVFMLWMLVWPIASLVVAVALLGYDGPRNVLAIGVIAPWVVVGLLLYER